MPRKVIINTNFGGFSLSKEVEKLYLEATKGTICREHCHFSASVQRDDPVLIQIIEDIGLENAGGRSSILKIVELPDDVPADGWMIMEYDGSEWAAEKHRTWN